MEFLNSGPLKVRPYPSLNCFFRRTLHGVRTIYDHGCGYGAWTNYLSQLSGARVTVYDPDISAAQYTKNLLGDRSMESIGPYDAIMCFAVLELLTESEQKSLLLEFRSKTNKLIILYNVYSPLALRWLVIRLLKGDPIEWHEKNRFHRSYLTARQVESLFIASGFRIARRCTPAVENHLPRILNMCLAPLFPISMHSTIYYALE
jgi:hypothetical protein